MDIVPSRTGVPNPTSSLNLTKQQIVIDKRR